MVILTGDTHSSFQRIYDLCEQHNTTTNDFIIILGDAGFNYFLNNNDLINKKKPIVRQ